jgi:hypothetical protein
LLGEGLWIGSSHEDRRGVFVVLRRRNGTLQEPRFVKFRDITKTTGVCGDFAAYILLVPDESEEATNKFFLTAAPGGKNSNSLRCTPDSGGASRQGGRFF